MTGVKAATRTAEERTAIERPLVTSGEDLSQVRRLARGGATYDARAVVEQLLCRCAGRRKLGSARRRARAATAS